MIDFLLDVLTSSPAITAGTNAAWGGLGALVALGLHLLVRYRGNELPAYVVASFKWGRLPGVCVALHRSYWNFGIFFRGEGETYHPFFTDHKHWLSILVLGIIIGTFKATLPFLDQSIRNKTVAAGSAFLITSAITAALLAV